MLLRRVSSRILVQRRGRTDDGTLDEHKLVIPTGKSDVGFETRITYLSKEATDDRIGIRGMSQTGFRMYDLNFLWGPIACFPTVAVSWKVKTPEEINEESLDMFFALRPKLDVLVLGVGARKNVDIVRKNVVKVAAKHRVGLELMVTEDAVTTFNFLNAEHRYVAGAFFPQIDLKVSDRENAESLNLHQSIDYVPMNPLLENYTHPFDEGVGIVNRMFGPGKKADEVLEIATKIKELDRQIKESRMYMKMKAEEEKLSGKLITRGLYGEKVIADGEEKKRSELTVQKEVEQRYLEGKFVKKKEVKISRRDMQLED
ncbi:unnamed protein product [Bursaphelenchus xylophilus]|uniref:(pine wood nematode) hypothetical protein n=1 Tax=Bursaphelenchus xylophilus TaxID=6326 RepID=A0A1I7RI18_BURXY|nr:unnamed protein product [Bursaphelenchus xylophilus]CAG9115219.1 unnamed protein product [Bursaphelenchus xylophilus]